MLGALRLLPSSLLLLGMCACVAASARRGLPEGAVTFRFAWPETLSARVTHVILAGGDEGQRIYWWKVVPGPEQGQRRLLVQEDAPTEPGLSAFADPESTILFDAEGTFLGSEPPEHAPVMGMIEALPLSAEQQGELRQKFETSMREVAEARWKQRVAHWRGVTLVPGEVVRFESRMWVGQDAFDRKEVEAEERTTFESGVACSEEVPEKRCVRLLVETTPVRPYEGSDPCARSRASKRFELVTDPHTLLPYLTRSLRKDEMDKCREDGTVVTRELVQGEAFVFTYGMEPVPEGTYSRR